MAIGSSGRYCLLHSRVTVIVMGLIREPKNIEFTVLDKPWTAKERQEFSSFIKLRKEQYKKKLLKRLR
jgi:hypothetical protein